MFEAELFLGGIGLGIVIAIYIWPKLVWPRLKERWIAEEKHAHAGRPKGSKNKEKPS